MFKYTSRTWKHLVLEHWRVSCDAINLQGVMLVFRNTKTYRTEYVFPVTGVMLQQIT